MRMRLIRHRMVSVSDDMTVPDSSSYQISARHPSLIIPSCSRTMPAWKYPIPTTCHATRRVLDFFPLNDHILGPFLTFRNTPWLS